MLAGPAPQANKDCCLLWPENAWADEFRQREDQRPCGGGGINNTLTSDNTLTRVWCDQADLYDKAQLSGYFIILNCGI